MWQDLLAAYAAENILRRSMCRRSAGICTHIEAETFHKEGEEGRQGAVRHTRQEVVRHCVPVLGVLKTFGDMIPAPWVLFAASSGVRDESRVRHELFTLGKPPNFLGSANKHEKDYTHADGGAAKEEVDYTPGSKTAALLGIQRDIVHAHAEDDREELV